MSFNVVCLLSAIFLASVALNCCSACEGLRKVFLEVKHGHGERSNITLNGCIQKSSFDGSSIDGRTITEMHIKHQNIPRLGKDYIRQLTNLDTLEITDCKMEFIARGAFRGIYKIRVVEITHNLLKEVTGGIFDIFDSIKILRLNNNKISSMTDEALSNMTMTEVNFSHNEFTKWRSVWFAYSPDIQKIDFSYNRIGTLPRRAFDGMPVLKEVNFEHNQLNFIDREAFRRLKSLEVLNLKSNLLSSLDPNIFPREIEIKSLNIAFNNFYNLPKNILEKLKLQDIIIDYNPWLCPCMTDLNNWLNMNNVNLQNADDCNLNYLPVCLNAEQCMAPQSNASFTIYKNLFKSLSQVDKKCIGF